jgi:hypothetical protein
LSSGENDLEAPMPPLAARLFRPSTHSERLMREESTPASRTPLQENYDAESIRRHCRLILACERKSTDSFFEEASRFVSGGLYFASRSMFLDWEPAAVFWVGDDGLVSLAAVDGGSRGVELGDGAAGLRPEEVGRRLKSLRGREWCEADVEHIG